MTFEPRTIVLKASPRAIERYGLNAALAENYDIVHNVKACHIDFLDVVFEIASQFGRETYRIPFRDIGSIKGLPRGYTVVDEGGFSRHYYPLLDNVR